MSNVILKTNDGVRMFFQRKILMFFKLFMVQEQLRAVSSWTKLVPSGTYVKVQYNDSTTTFSVPNLA